VRLFNIAHFYVLCRVITLNHKEINPVSQIVAVAMATQGQVGQPGLLFRGIFPGRRPSLLKNLEAREHHCALDDPVGWQMHQGGALNQSADPDWRTRWHSVRTTLLPRIFAGDALAPKNSNRSLYPVPGSFVHAKRSI